jgi:hypothetical protein
MCLLKRWIYSKSCFSVIIFQSIRLVISNGEVNTLNIITILNQQMTYTKSSEGQHAPQSQHLGPFLRKNNLESITVCGHGYKSRWPSWIRYSIYFLVQDTHISSLLKQVFHNLTLFILQTACKLKRACTTCAPGYVIILMNIEWNKCGRHVCYV